ncbi:MAG TPA: MaoC family dehydratase [Caulobacteraceae bacterium]|nr:MaoC family dehydratase [Caulobacteraceae bacterium]
MASKVGALFLEDLAVGQSVERTVTIREADIEAFAAVSGDTNPVHLDEAYAQTTPFKSRIAHGMLLGAYISAVLGVELPGPGAIYQSQTLNFKRAVRIGDEVLIRVRVEAIDLKTGTATLSTHCSVGRKSMLAGEATVLVPRRGEAEAA